MIEVHAALMLHESGQPVNEENLKKVLSSTGSNVDDNKVKALVAALQGVNIDEALKEAVSFAAAAPTAVEKKEEDTEKAAEQASAGLSSLFG